MANLSNINNKFLVTTGGNVGINKTSPEEKLDIAGSVLISNNEFYKVEKTDGTNYKIAGLTNGNVIQIGAIDYTSAGTIFAGGDNIGITTGGAAGTTRIKIDSSGNVGIGTISPIQKLDTPNIVIGGSTIAGTYRANALFMDNNGGNSRFYSSGADASTKGSYEFNIMASDANPLETPLVITNTGNVGIGTTTPYAFDTTATKLHVKNASAGSGNVGEVARFEGSSDADGSGGTIRLGTSNDRGIYFEGGRTGSVPYGIIGTTEYNGAKTYSIYLQNTGNVGVGTESPSQKLHVNSSTNNPTGIGLQNSERYYSVRSNNYSLVFTDETVGTERMRIDSSGNVGIGTSSPTTLLNTLVTANSENMTLGSAANMGFKIGNTTGNEYGICMGVGNSGRGWIQVGRTDGTATAYDLTLQSSGGSVGIGTTAPDRTLDVRGTGMSIFGTGDYTELMLRGQVEGTGTVRNVGAFHWSIRSDVGGDNDDLKLLRFVTGSYAGIAMQVQNSTGDIFFGNTVVNPASGFSNQRGLGYDNSTGNLEAASTSGTPMTIGRNEASDGQILQLRKESTIKHSFGSTTSYLLGNVGIGLTNPSEKLDVNGRVKWVTATGGDIYLFAGSKYYLDGGSNTYIVGESPDGDNIGFVTGGSTAMTIDENQNVGIGTTSPGYPLDVIKGTEIQARFVGSQTGHTQGAILLQSGTADTPQARGQGVYRFNEGNDDTWYTGTAYANTDKYIWARKASTTSFDSGAAQLTYALMTLQNTGNLGIGTTSPNQSGYSTDSRVVTVKAPVSGGASTLELIGLANADNNLAGAVSFMSYAGGTPLASIQGLRHTSDTSGKLRFDTAGSERMRITETGSVAIGATTTQAQLEVRNSSDGSTTAPQFLLYGGASSYGAFHFIDSDAYHVQTNSAGRDIEIICNTGGVKLGPGDTSWSSNSDENLKENIKPLHNVLDKIKDYRCVEYNFKDDENEDKKIGFIAQDWQKDFSQVVNKNKQDVLSIKYTETIPVLLKAIQELEARVKELENK